MLGTSDFRATRPRHRLPHARAHSAGPITRLVSPSDLGEVIKPFVFLDLFDLRRAGAPMSMELRLASALGHRHGDRGARRIASASPRRPASQACCRPAASSGCAPATASGTPAPPSPGRVRGFQLWVALPPELENAANASHYVMPERCPPTGPVRVILGAYGKTRSPIAAPPMTYLAVSLKAGRALDLPSRPRDTRWPGSPCTRACSGRLAPFPAGSSRSSSRREESIDFVAEGRHGSCSARRRSIRTTSPSATTRCTPAPRPCCAARRRSGASAAAAGRRDAAATDLKGMDREEGRHRDGGFSILIRTLVPLVSLPPFLPVFLSQSVSDGCSLRRGQWLGGAVEVDFDRGTRRRDGGAEPGAAEEHGGDAEVAERHHRRLADADLLAVHEAEEGQHRAGQREARRLHELAVDDEHARSRRGPGRRGSSRRRAPAGRRRARPVRILPTSSSSCAALSARRWCRRRASALLICSLPQAARCGTSASTIAGAWLLRRFLERLRADQHADVEQDRQRSPRSESAPASPRWCRTSRAGSP